MIEHVANFASSRDCRRRHAGVYARPAASLLGVTFYFPGRFSAMINRSVFYLRLGAYVNCAETAQNRFLLDSARPLRYYRILAFGACG